jgi:hypothetical protein
MRSSVFALAGVPPLVIAVVLGAHRMTAVPDAHADVAPARVPVLVELFTSEGCSSCPPAEDELARLDVDQPVDRARVVTLAYHVDYWNDLGWPDPYSSAVWTARQHVYDRDGQLYTPQAVVQGERQCVGSDDSTLRRLVGAAAARPAARVSVASRAEGNAVRAAVTVAALPSVSTGDRAEVWAALVERGVENLVARGENAGRRLRHAPLVRDRGVAGVVSGGGGSLDVVLTVPEGARRDALGVVAVVQEARSGRVLGVGTD